MRKTSITIATLALGLLLGACVQDDRPAQSSGGSNKAESEGGTSFSVDTSDGSMSYEKKEGGDNTSISIGDGDKKD